MFGYDVEYAQKKAEQIKQAKRKIVGLATIGAIVIFALIVLFQSFTIVKPGYHGVKYAFGTVQPEEAGQGMNWHAPWVDIDQYPTSTEVEKRIIEKNDDGEITEDNTFMLNTGDGKSVKVALTYNYHYQPDGLDRVFTKFRRKSGPEIADQYIDQEILNIGQNLTTEHSVLEVYSQKRSEINTTWFDELQASLAKDDIVLEKFTIVDVIPDEKTLAILQQVADEENKRELVKRQRATLKEQELNIEQQNANNKKTAEGEKAVALIKASENAERAVIEAEGRAEANRQLQASLTQNILTQQWIEAWKAGGAQVPKMTGSNDAFIQVPSDIFK